MGQAGIAMNGANSYGQQLQRSIECTRVTTISGVRLHLPRAQDGGAHVLSPLMAPAL